MLILRSRASFSIARAQIIPTLNIQRTVAVRHFSTTAATHSNPKLERSQDLLAKGSAYLANGEFQEAFPLLETALELQQKYEGNLEGTDAGNLYLKLGLVYHQLGKTEQAEAHYLKAIKTLSALNGETDRDVGIAHQYHAELQASLGKNQEALESIKRAVSIIRNYHQDIYLGGALANQATILTFLGDYEAALQSCSEALDLFLADLGRNNPHTKKCFGNMYLILKKLGKDDAELRQKWEAADRITPQDFKGLTDQEVSDTLQEFAWSIKKAEPKFTPTGFTKGPAFVRKEISQFVDLWQKKGNLFNDAHFEVLGQESHHFQTGLTTRKRLQEELKEKRELLVEQRKGAAEKEAGRLKVRKEERRLKREARIFTHERKYTEQVMGYVGMKYDDTFVSRKHRARIYEAEKQELENPEAGPVELPELPKAKDVLWNLQFRDYDNPSVDWRQIPVIDQSTYIPGDDTAALIEAATERGGDWTPKFEDKALEEEEETMSEGVEEERRQSGPRRKLQKKAERE